MRVRTYVHGVIFLSNAHPHIAAASFGKKVGRLSIETRTRVITLWRAKYSVKTIIDRLEGGGISVSRIAIFNLIVKFEKTDTVADITLAPRSS